MCTSIVSNRKKTVIGWNLDILGMEHKIITEDSGVYIAVFDSTEGWMPLFGANSRGEFVGMPTCWPYDGRSDPVSAEQPNIINLDIDLLLCKTDFESVRRIAETGKVCSIPGTTFQAQLSDADGNVLQIVPGQGTRYLERPKFSVLTNFSPYKGDSELHPWMGLDRYEKAVSMLEAADDDFGVRECFAVLKEASQTVCPTVVSMVFDVSELTVYTCENREWGSVVKKRLTPYTEAIT